MSDRKLPEIEYPTVYTFRAIGRKGPGLRERVRQIVQAELGHVAEDSVTEQPSREGTYTSIRVMCILTNEEQRKAVYARLHADDQVVFVL